MLPFGVVEQKIFPQAQNRFWNRRVIVQINVLILHAAPKPLDKNIVQRPASVVHADLDALRLQTIREVDTRELTSLVRIENLRSAGEPNCLIQGFQAEGAIQGHGHVPCQHIAAVPVDDRHQIHKPTRQANVGDVRAPDLVSRSGGGFYLMRLSDFLGSILEVIGNGKSASKCGARS